MTMSMLICRAQLSLAKKVEKWGGGGDIWRQGEEDAENGMRITMLKTNVFSAAAEKKQCLILSEACLVACSWGWMRNVLAPERFLCSR